jgi:hypothetical protein
MKILFLFIVVCFSFHFHVKAQGNFQKGFVITNEGDTLKGYINDRAWIENPEKIYFREFLESAEEKIFDLSNASFFQIDGAVSYQRFYLSVSMDEVKFSNLHIGVDTSKTKMTVFLKILVEGCYVSLYSYTDAVKSRFYYMEKSTEKPVELSYRTYYYKSPELSDKQMIITLSNYIGQLKYLASKFGTYSKEVKRTIENSDYQAEELSEAMILINGNNALNYCRTIASRERVQLFFFTGINMERSNLDYMEAAGGMTVNSESKHKALWLPVLMAGFDVKKNTGSRLFIRAELSFSYYDLTASDVYSEPLNYYKNNYEYNLSQWNINLSNSLNYNFVYASKIKAYMGAGFDIHFSVDVTTSYYAIGQSPYGDDYSEYHDLLPPSQIWVSFPITVGFIYKDHCNIYYHYHIPFDKYDAQLDNRLIKSMEIGIAYLF